MGWFHCFLLFSGGRGKVLVIETKMCYVLFMVRRWWGVCTIIIVWRLESFLISFFSSQVHSTNATLMQSRHGAGSGMISTVPCLNLMPVL